MIKRIVIAGTAYEYEEFLRLTGFDRVGSPLIRTIEQLHGYDDIRCYTVGTYEHLKDYAEMQLYALNHNLIPGGIS